MSGDFLMTVQLPLLRALGHIRDSFKPRDKRSEYIGGGTFSKYDQAQGTGLRMGDYVIAISPVDPHRSVAKRVIGLPGDTICIDPRLAPLPISAWKRFSHKEVTPRPPPVSSGVDQLLNESMDTSSPEDTQTKAHNRAVTRSIRNLETGVQAEGVVQYVTVPMGHVWLAGDNTANSTDSRHYGPVPLGMVRGKVLARVWPGWQWLLNKSEES